MRARLREWGDRKMICRWILRSRILLPSHAARACSSLQVAHFSSSVSSLQVDPNRLVDGLLAGNRFSLSKAITVSEALRLPWYMLFERNSCILHGKNPQLLLYSTKTHSVAVVAPLAERCDMFLYGYAAHRICSRRPSFPWIASSGNGLGRVNHHAKISPFLWLPLQHAKKMMSVK